MQLLLLLGFTTPRVACYFSHPTFPFLSIQVLASLLELCLFFWTPLKTAMIVFIGHNTGPEVASISAATATTMFATGELEWSAPYYELISVLTGKFLLYCAPPPPL